MNNLQNMFKNQPNVNMKNNNIFMQLMTMGEEERAQIIADALNKQGITSKEQLENFIKKFRR